MLQNTPLTNLSPQLWRMECGGDLFLGKRQSIPVLLSQQRCQGTEAPLHNRNQVLHGGRGPPPSHFRCLCLRWGFRYSHSPGPSTFSSEDPTVAHTTPLNPFRPQWVAAFGREDKTQILRGGSQWEVQPAFSSGVGMSFPTLTWALWELRSEHLCARSLSLPSFPPSLFFFPDRCLHRGLAAVTKRLQKYA